MFKILRRFAQAASILAFSTVASNADVKLQDGTILSDKPTFIVTYIEADVASSDAVADLIKKQTTQARAKMVTCDLRDCSGLVRAITSS